MAAAPDEGNRPFFGRRLQEGEEDLEEEEGVGAADEAVEEVGEVTVVEEASRGDINHERVTRTSFKTCQEQFHLNYRLLCKDNALQR